MRDMLNDKLKIGQNRQRTESDTDNDDDEKEIPEETSGRSYDASERDGLYEPMRTNPEKDAIEIHTDGEIYRVRIMNL